MLGTRSLRILAPAKINLFLRVTGRRADGYHSLISRMQKLTLFDELILERLSVGIELRCPDGRSPEGPENLVHRAAALFLAKRPEAGGVRITLTKNIPAAAGLGGGSSDAAAALCGLNALHGAPLTEDALAALGLELGADVPFFVQQAPAALAEGVGERLRPAPSLRDCFVLLVNPGFPVSTAWVYRNLDFTRLPHEASFPDSQDAGWREMVRAGGCVNDLETVTPCRYPVVAEVKAAMRAQGAALALMSGAGPTVFGLFADRAAAETAWEHFRREFAESFLVEPLRD